MELKPNLTLRKMGNRYMLVDVSDADANISSVHTLNESAAFLWECAEKYGVDPERLASILCERYDVGYDMAVSDVRELMASWRQAGLLVGQD